MGFNIDVGGFVESLVVALPFASWCSALCLPANFARKRTSGLGLRHPTSGVLVGKGRVWGRSGTMVITVPATVPIESFQRLRIETYTDVAAAALLDQLKTNISVETCRATLLPLQDRLSPTLYIEKVFLDSLVFSPYPSPATPGCLLTAGNPIIAASFVIVILFETRVQHYRIASGRGFVSVLYRDGVVFYIYLFGISVVNLIVIVACTGQFSRFQQHIIPNC
ncbi:hypothetical protein QCA50_016650 [Cerrena zonata]|uniref:Uncharacterized protein n=1 Tax=Cerrena zonata TaxID=2478898 RepID=A0AAW0FUL6_9APHY